MNRPLPSSDRPDYHSSLERQFIEFLITEKGYPSLSFSRDFPISAPGSSERYFVDLVLTDPIEKLFLAFVEFKGSGSEPVIRKVIRIVRKMSTSTAFRNAIIPLYVVVPYKDSFEIYGTGVDINGKIVKIEKADFPDFMQLSLKSELWDKATADAERGNIAKDTRRSRELYEGYARGALTGFVVLLFAVLFVYLDPFSGMRTSKIVAEGTYEARPDSAQTARIVNEVLDKYYQKNIITVGDSTLKNLDNRYLTFRALEDRIYKDVELQLSKSVEGRMRNLELMLSKEPEKTLSILEMKAELAAVKALVESKNEMALEKISGVKEKIDFYIGLIWALIIGVGTTLLGFGLTYYFSEKEKKEKAEKPGDVKLREDF